MLLIHFIPSIVGTESQAIYDRVEGKGHEIGISTSPKRQYTDYQPHGGADEDSDQQLKFMQFRASKDIDYARAPRMETFRCIMFTTTLLSGIRFKHPTVCVHMTIRMKFQLKD